MPGPKHKIGEALARLIMAIGFYEGMGYNPTYEDLARATGRSLSRIRTIASDAMKRGLVKVVSRDVRVRLGLTEEGRRIYSDLYNAVKERGAPQTAMDAVKKLDNILYSDSKPEKWLGSSTIVAIDVAVPALKIPEIVNEIKKRVGAKIIAGLAAELASAVEVASSSGLGNVGFGDLAKTVLNVPIRIVRVLEVALPPHIEGVPLRLGTIVESLKGLSIWPGRVDDESVYRYAGEADALGLVKLYTSSSYSEALVEPLLGAGLEVVDKVADVGFDVIAANPSRAWLPILSIYGDATQRLVTTSELVECSTELLSILRDSEGFGYERCQEWVEHALGMKRKFKVPALAREAPSDTYGVLARFRADNTEWVLTLTTARRIAGHGVSLSVGVKHVLDEAVRRVKSIMEMSGVYGEVLKVIGREGFMSREEFEREVKRILEAYRVEGTPGNIIRDLESLGFIRSTSHDYYSAWSITPLGFADAGGKPFGDDNMRSLLVWIAKEIFSSKYRSTIMEQVIRKLIEGKEVDIIAEVDNERERIAVVRRLAFLDKAGLVEFADEGTKVRVRRAEDDKPKKLLTIAYLAHRIGLLMPQIEVREGKKPELGDVIIEAGEKFKLYSRS